MAKQNNPKLNLLIIGVIMALAFGWVTLYMVNQVQAAVVDTCEDYQIKFDRDAYQIGDQWPVVVNEDGFLVTFFTGEGEGDKGVDWWVHEDLEVTEICVKTSAGLFVYPGDSNFSFTDPLNRGEFRSPVFDGTDVSHIAFNFDGSKGDITPTPTDEEKEATPTPTPTVTPSPTETETPTPTPTDEEKKDTPTPTPTEIGTSTPPPKEPVNPTPTDTDKYAGGGIITGRPTTWWQSFLNWLCQIGVNLGQCN